MTVHSEQAASVIRRAVQTILARGLNDPRVRGLVSVTEVKLSEDGSQARVFVSILPAEHSELTMHGLHHAAKYIRGQLGKEVRLRRLPRIEFRLDKSIKKQSEVMAALAAARKRDGEAGGDVERESATINTNPSEVSES